MSISVTMAYYNRPNLLRNTLWAYHHLHPDISDCEFVVVDDQSDPGLGAEDVAKEFRGILDIRVLVRVHKTGRNPAVPINASVRAASGDVVIITNPETLPLAPVLHAVASLADRMEKTYLVVPCYSVSSAKQVQIDSCDPSRPDFLDRVWQIISPNPRRATYDGDDGWYEHPTLFPRGLYFCAAIRREDFMAVGGIDEDFQMGDAWEDNDFLRRLAQNSFEMGYISDVACAHQHHYSTAASKKHGPGPSRDNALLFQQKASQGVLVANQGREWGQL